MKEVWTGKGKKWPAYFLGYKYLFENNKTAGHMLGKSIAFVNVVMLSTALAQGVRISGTILDYSGAPIANAQIALGAGGLTASSDAQGRFTVSNSTGLGEPTISGLSSSIRNGFLNLRLANQSKVTLAVFSTKGEKLSYQSLTLGTGEHALPLFGKTGYYIYKLSANEQEFAFTHSASSTRSSEGPGQNRDIGSGQEPFHLAKPAASAAAFNDVLKVTAGGYINYEGILFASGEGIDTSGLKIVLLKEGDLPRFSFFVTSLAAMRALSGNQKGFGGDLRYGYSGPGAGLRGADRICADAAELGLKGSSAKQWRAFLSVSDAGNGAKKDAIDRIGPGPWYDRLGRLVASNVAGLTGADRPAGEPTISADLPNESGEPNHSAGGVTMDNHDVLTGSDKTGRLHTNQNCNDWTSTTATGGGAGGFGSGPMAGHSWPASSGRNWLQAHGVPGCAASVVSGQGTFNGTGVGDGGGYGAIYCFALVP